MDFEEFKRICYHTRASIKIPGSPMVIDKSSLFNKGKYDPNKEHEALEMAYEKGDYKNR